jgi:hypothetical protein
MRMASLNFLARMEPIAQRVGLVFVEIVDGGLGGFQIMVLLQRTINGARPDRGEKSF